MLTGCFTKQPGALVELFKGRAPDFWTLGLAELVEGHCSGDFLLQGQPGHGVVSSLSLPSKRDQRRGSGEESKWETLQWQGVPSG